MGYTTEFDGQLSFGRDMLTSELAVLTNLFDECISDHPEWAVGDRLGYIDIELTKDFTGVKHNGAEKTYDFERIVNVFINQARMKIPNFSLTGQLTAQGEEVGDIWVLKMVDGVAVKIETPPEGDKICCPHCDEDFYYNSEK